MEKDYFQNMNQTDTARCFGVTIQQIRAWVNQGIPSGMGAKKKTFDSVQVHEWLVERAVQKVKGRKTPAPRTTKMDDIDPELEPNGVYDDNLDRVRLATAQIKELELERMKGKLISREKHEDFMRRCAEFVRQSFQAKPRQLATKLARMNDANEIETFLQGEIIGVLERMSQLEMSDD